jgi:hypothetical protein
MSQDRGDQNRTLSPGTTLLMTSSFQQQAHDANVQTVQNSQVPFNAEASSQASAETTNMRQTQTARETEITSPAMDHRFPFESATMVELFRRLNDTFYAETFLWIYLNSLKHPAARRLRYRLGLLGMATGRSTEQAAANVLSGYLTGYRQSRRTLAEQVETVLQNMTSAVPGGPDSGGQPRRAAWLGQLSVELGVALNPRQMMKSFSAVVRDLVARTPAAVECYSPGVRWMSRAGHRHCQYRHRHHFQNDVSGSRSTESAFRLPDIDALNVERTNNSHPFQRFILYLLKLVNIMTD